MKSESLTLWELQHKKNIKLLEIIQRRAKRIVKGLDRKLYEGWLRALGLLRLEGLSGNFIVLFNNLKRGRKAAGTDVFTFMIGDRTRGNNMKLSEGGLGWISGKVSSPTVCLGTGTSSPGKCTKVLSSHSTSPDRAQEVFGQNSHAHGVTLGVSYTGSGVGLNNPCGSFPTHCILQFYYILNLKFTFLGEQGLIHFNNIANERYKLSAPMTAVSHYKMANVTFPSWLSVSFTESLESCEREPHVFLKTKMMTEKMQVVVG